MLEDVARVCNRFPLIEINVHECRILKFEKSSGFAKILVRISLERDL